VFGRKVVFHLQGEGAPLLDTVKDLPFVREVRAVDNKLVVTLDDPEAHNPAIIRALVGAGADLQFVGELRHSLEAVYLELVKAA
jgi:ABC-2 type transport system ATP-binding protein